MIISHFENKNAAPKPDIAICSECQWRGPTSDCETEQDGDYESGYYLVDVCPKCEDGGCIDDYDYSDEQGNKYEIWDLIGIINRILRGTARSQAHVR